MSMRFSFVVSIVLSAALMTGCCCGPGPVGCGPCAGSCNNCDDAGYDGPPVVYGPLDGLRQMRKSLVCGGGCGEVYYGEWTGSPPDACDPCCGGEFVGGATPCVPFCWRPGYFLGCLTGWYGQRYCNGCGNSANQCGCGFNWGCGGANCSDSSCSGSCNSNEMISGGDGGCSTCNAGSSESTRTAKPPQKVDSNHRTARSNAIRRGMSTSGSNRPTRYR